MILGAIDQLSSSLTSLFPNPLQQNNSSSDFAALLAQKQESGQLTEQQVESAEELLRALGNQSTVKPAHPKCDCEEPGKSLSLNDLREQNAELQESFEKRLRSLLLENGIPSQINLDIRTDLAGQPIVDTPHPEQARITELIQNDPELLNLFNQLSANQSILETAAEHTDFAQAYAADPEQAIDLFAHLFKPQGFSDFSLKYEGTRVIAFGGVA